MIEIPAEYQAERFKAFDALPDTIRRRLLTDPDHNNLDFIIDCGLRNYAVALGQVALDMALCQSPIEMMLFIELDKAHHKNPIIAIEPQKEMVCNGRKYRADFLITYGEIYLEKSNVGYLVVECDGHDFHEKTKKQATRDKQRDRDMQIDGYRVMRFTGSEIYRDAKACVAEVSAYINNALK